MPLPAIALLDASCPIKPAWAIFDPVWYLKKYHHRLPSGLTPAPQTLLNHYLQIGCRAGHSPGALFDETFYLAANPDIAILVEAGHFRSGFDHFCQYGHRGLSPHWLFDDKYYADHHEDMALENLDLHQFHGRYDHYLKSGQHEHRSAHPLFDSRFYRTAAIAAGDDAAGIDASGAFTHYLARPRSGAAELPPSIYFDPDWYVQHHAFAPAEIEEEGFSSALEHYLSRDMLDPLAEFSEPFYRESNPDVRHLIETGQFRNGYHHFLTYGAFELRSPSPEVDLLLYRDANSRVRNDLNAGLVRDAFAHLRSIGSKLGLVAAPFSGLPEITEAAAKELFIAKARANLVLFARARLDFTPAAPPVLAVVMVLFEKFELTMLSLCALRDNYPGSIELIIIDNASTDDTPHIGQYVDGAKITLLAKNIGYLHACNLGLQQVTAPLVLFLNNDVELGHGAVAAAISRLQSDPKIGAVGGKIIRTHGELQEAGSIVWKDGTVSGYMRDATPLAPEANFVRDVDFCSGAFLLCRGELIEQLGGFDADFSPAYYEDADLCLRIAASGYRVVYDPGIVIHHLEYGSATDTEASMTLMRRGRQIFLRKHESYLQRKFELTEENTIFARSSDNSRKRILFIEDTIPLRRLGSGYVRANDVVRAIAVNHGVSVFPLNGAPYDIMSLYGDFPDHLEILHDRNIDGLTEFLKNRRGYYDAIWISRTHNLGRILPILLESGIDPERIPLIMDTEAIATLRDAARAALEATPFDFDAKLRAEFAAASRCRHLIAVNRREADLLRDVGFPAISILGTMREPCATSNAFAAREGMLFVAGIHQPDSPNLDALHWYADAILPALIKEMRHVPLLNVVGHIEADIDLSRFADHKHIKIHGPAADLTPFYNQNRLFIAPTRFAAGTPYKLYETASFGLPCVATVLLAEQLEWRPGTDLLAAPVEDAKKFAAQIAHLYRSEQTWNELRANALGRISKENTAVNFDTAVASIFNSVELLSKKGII